MKLRKWDFKINQYIVVPGIKGNLETKTKKPQNLREEQPEENELKNSMIIKKSN